MNHAVIQKLFCDNRNIIEKEIKIRTHGLINSGCFYLGEFDDISSELRMKVLVGLAFYNSEKGSVKAYVRKILERKSIDLIRERKTRMRQCIQLLSTEEIFEDFELGNAKMLSEFFCTQGDTFSAFDINSAITNLPDELRAICNLLSESYNALEISKILKKSRTTINKRISEIRRRLKDFK